MPVTSACSPAEAGAQREAVAGPDMSGWTPAFAGERLLRSAPLAALTLLTACATQTSAGVEAEAPGVLLGLWHGFIFPVAWVLSLFMPDVAVYAVPNNGGWYDFGYFVGIVFIGVGARKSHIVYRDRIVRVR